MIILKTLMNFVKNEEHFEHIFNISQMLASRWMAGGCAPAGRRAMGAPPAGDAAPAPAAGPAGAPAFVGRFEIESFYLIFQLNDQTL